MPAGEILRELQALAGERLGLALPSNCSRLERALDEAARNLGVPDREHSFRVLAALPLGCDAWRAIIDALTVGETSFFRQRSWFEQLEQHVLGEIIERKRRDGSQRLQIWSVGCSTGEEAYTLAMIVDRLIPDRSRWRIDICGTDLNERSLSQAGAAIYSEWSLREVDHHNRARYFTRIAPERFQVKDEIRRMVSFQRANLAAPSTEGNYPAGIDLTVCRNVLMHLTEAGQTLVAKRLISSRGEGGWIAVTPAESVSARFVPLVPLNVPGAIFFRLEPPRAETAAPALAFPEPRRAARPSRLRRAPAVVPEDRGKRIDRARALADTGDLNAAREHCEAELRVDPLSYEGTLLLAAICDEMQDLEAALCAARRAVYLRPRSPLAYLTAKKAAERLGRTKRARLAQPGSSS